MILTINCVFFLTAIFGLVYHAEPVKINIKPVSGEPSFLTRSGLLTLRKGETIELPCNYKGSYKKEDYPDEIEITWKKVEGARANLFGIDLEGANETRLAVGDKLNEHLTRFSVERFSVELSKKGSKLIIANAKYGDAGHYVCQLGTNDNCQSHVCPIVYFDVKVNKASKIKRSPKNRTQIATKGDDITFSCDPMGDMELKVTWTRSLSTTVQQKFPDGDYTIESTEIYLENVNKDQAGSYFCTARNQTGDFIQQEKFYLDVKYAPDIKIDKEFINAAENNDIQIICFIDARPKANVTWFKDSEEIIEDEKKFTHNGDNYALFIPSLNFSDSGNYACKAQNTEGEKSSKMIQLAVFYDIDFIVDEMSNQGYRGKRYNIIDHGLDFYVYISVPRPLSDRFGNSKNFFFLTRKNL